VSDRPGPVAELLRRFRERAALTQEELADRSGVTAKAISALERGERRRPRTTATTTASAASRPS